MRQPIKQYLYSGATTKVIAHTMVWFDGHKHTVDPKRNPGYFSNDATAVKEQCEYLADCRVDLHMHNWYGPGTFENEATIVYFEQSPLGHIINIDGGAFRSESELNKCFEYVREIFFPHSGYERWCDKYILTLFAKSGNDPQWFRNLEAAHQDCVFVYNSTQWGYSQMEWIDSSLEVGVDWFCRTFSQRTNGLFIPAAFPGFNDDRGNGESCWHPGQPARIWPAGAPGPGGNWTTLESCFEVINRFYDTEHQLEYLQLITCNDWDEGTQMERKFLIPETPESSSDKHVTLWANGSQLGDTVALPVDADLLTIVEQDESGAVLSATNLPLK